VASIRLDKFKLKGSPIDLLDSNGNPVAAEASGLAFDDDRKRLLVLDDERCEGKVCITETSADGVFRRQFKVCGVRDVEGITRIEGDTFAVVDELKARVWTVEIPADSDDDLTPRRLGGKIGNVSAKKHGFEGIAYDARRRRLYAVRENQPDAVYRSKPLDEGCKLPKKRWKKRPLKWKKGKQPRDVSDIHVHENGNLLILSDDSKILAEFDPKTGKELSRIKLTRGKANGLPEDIPQAEGVTMSRDGVLYICSDNGKLDPRVARIYVFIKQ
jgi:uncharacterized protein YjiK